MSFFPRFVSHDFPRFGAGEFAPVWRLLDDYANQVASVRNSDYSSQRPASVRSFNPRFDVKEVDGGYELQGELPGVDQSNVEIEFPDHQTLVIKGSTQYSREEDRQPTTQVAVDSKPEESQHAQHQPTVEDEPEPSETSGANTEATPSEFSKASEAVPETQQQVQKASSEVEPSSRYWLTERFTGQFQRTFNFPVPVDTDSTTAKLKNGVLEVHIPKAQKAGSKRINVQ